jgi:hypothetical protein
MLTVKNLTFWISLKMFILSRLPFLYLQEALHFRSSHSPDVIHLNNQSLLLYDSTQIVFHEHTNRLTKPKTVVHGNQHKQYKIPVAFFTLNSLRLLWSDLQSSRVLSKSCDLKSARYFFFYFFFSFCDYMCNTLAALSAFCRTKKIKWYQTW